MIKIIKRKNPDLQGNEFIDDKFFRLLFDAVVYNIPQKFSQALVYKNIGLKECIDCSDENETHNYRECTCENYLDDYNIPNVHDTPIQLVNGVKNQLKYFSPEQLIKFKDQLIDIDMADDNYMISNNQRNILIDHINNLFRRK